ncbi:MAG: flagellar protein FliT [Rouxiella aceris]|uniref:flagellar protein FliT n=1 Tax=Rouxiella aceris TaxID=2703884 RepID=UPI0028489D5B|nr:flagellar protein FliT [Rouxiella aceris]MDR3432236.1 flagellar protein FliT [Rouxiella aceris]
MMTAAVLATFQRLQQIVAAMQNAAESADWDCFLSLQEGFRPIAANLPQHGSFAVNDSEQEQLADLLRQIQVALDIVLPLAQARRAVISGKLAGIHNAGKLNRTYQP